MEKAARGVQIKILFNIPACARANDSAANGHTFDQKASPEMEGFQSPFDPK